MPVGKPRSEFERSYRGFNSNAPKIAYDPSQPRLGKPPKPPLPGNNYKYHPDMEMYAHWPVHDGALVDTPFCNVVLGPLLVWIFLCDIGQDRFMLSNGLEDLKRRYPANFSHKGMHSVASPYGRPATLQRILEIDLPAPLNAISTLPQPGFDVNQDVSFLGSTIARIKNHLLVGERYFPDEHLDQKAHQFWLVSEEEQDGVDDIREWMLPDTPFDHNFIVSETTATFNESSDLLEVEEELARWKGRTVPVAKEAMRQALAESEHTYAANRTERDWLKFWYPPLRDHDFLIPKTLLPPTCQGQSAALPPQCFLRFAARNDPRLESMFCNRPKLPSWEGPLPDRCLRVVRCRQVTDASANHGAGHHTNMASNPTGRDGHNADEGDRTEHSSGSRVAAHSVTRDSATVLLRDFGNDPNLVDGVSEMSTSTSAAHTRQSQAAVAGELTTQDGTREKIVGRLSGLLWADDLAPPPSLVARSENQHTWSAGTNNGTSGQDTRDNNEAAQWQNNAGGSVPAPDGYQRSARVEYSLPLRTPTPLQTLNSQKLPSTSATAIQLQQTKAELEAAWLRIKELEDRLARSEDATASEQLAKERVAALAAQGFQQCTEASVLLLVTHVNRVTSAFNVLPVDFPIAGDRVKAYLRAIADQVQSIANDKLRHIERAIFPDGTNPAWFDELVIFPRTSIFNQISIASPAAVPVEQVPTTKHGLQGPLAGSLSASQVGHLARNSGASDDSDHRFRVLEARYAELEARLPSNHLQVSTAENEDTAAGPSDKGKRKAAPTYQTGPRSKGPRTQ